MADVSPPPVPGTGASRGSPRGDDRGQLFLVGALALSVILVTLAVLLNTAIYTGNVATRDPGTGSADVIEYRAAANEMAGSTLTGVNYRNNASYGHLESNFTDSVENWSVAATTHSIVRGTDANVSVLNPPTHGTRIVQHGDRTLTSADGTTDWTLATNVRVRNYTLTVDRSTISTFASDPGVSEFDDSNFHVEVHDPDSTVYWKVYVYEFDAKAWVEVIRNDGSETSVGECSTTISDPTIDFTDATFAGDECPALTFWGETDVRHDVRYQNGGNTNGTYSLVVDEEYSTLESRAAYNADTADTSPYVTPALYSAEVSVTYRSPTVDYRTQFRVAPGEYDD